ncbi:MAG: hypothetical protein HY319_32480 [Armatimonadetes bacterium]|nr:hypothetical protein [Armatimonadota bacterium]
MLRCPACNSLSNPGYCIWCGERLPEPGPKESISIAHFLYWTSFMSMFAGELAAGDGIRPWVFPMLFLYALCHAWGLAVEQEQEYTDTGFLLVQPRRAEEPPRPKLTLSALQRLAREDFIRNLPPEQAAAVRREPAYRDRYADNAPWPSDDVGYWDSKYGRGR